jgi:hypothetical protein
MRSQAEYIKLLEQEEETAAAQVEHCKTKFNDKADWLKKALEKAQRHVPATTALIDHEIVAALQQTETALREFQIWEAALGRVRQHLRWARESA